MTNTELIAKIKAEIERRIETYKKGYANGDDRRADALELLLSFLDTLEEPSTSPWKKVHTYTEEIHEGDVEKMLSDLSVGEGEKWNKIAIPDRVVDALEEPVSVPPTGVSVPVQDVSVPPVCEELNEVAKAYTDARDWAKENYLTPYIRQAFIAGANWRDRQLNWVRDLVKAGIKLPDEAVNILQRIDALLNE